jgi:hypothetical protein
MARTAVYLDACCFSQWVSDPPNVVAKSELRSVLSEIEGGELAFIDSSWLHHELGLAEPASLRRRLLSLVPTGVRYVPWDRSIARDAELWVARLKLTEDRSGHRDCRHLVCALRGRADVLITYDANFYEKLRQHAKLLRGLRPAWLAGWQEVVHGG